MGLNGLFQQAQVFIRDFSTRFDCKLYCSVFDYHLDFSYSVHPRIYTQRELL